MNRRKFLSLAGAATLASCSENPKPSVKPTHIVSLSFDDGFIKSFKRIAEVHENYGLVAGFNIIASGHLSDFKAVDQWIRPELMGDFDDWNALQARGHEIMPHSYEHRNLGREPIDEAKRLIEKCTAIFESDLHQFDASKSVFNFPFNSSTPEIEAFVLESHAAVRTAGTARQRFPGNQDNDGRGYRIGCEGYGPGNGDAWIQNITDAFLADQEGGWLVLNLHGLDDEGWGPISTSALDKLLKRLAKMDTATALPIGKVIADRR